MGSDVLFNGVSIHRLFDVHNRVRKTRNPRTRTESTHETKIQRVSYVSSTTDPTWVESLIDPLLDEGSSEPQQSFQVKETQQPDFQSQRILDNWFPTGLKECYSRRGITSNVVPSTEVVSSAHSPDLPHTLSVFKVRGLD